MTTLRDAALAYAARGWPVFPCKPHAKEPLTAHGLRDATTSAPGIAAWWGRWPDANVAIATGVQAGLVVVDVDARHAGREVLRDLEAEYGQFPTTPHVLTGGGGDHYYFAHPGGHVKSRPVAPGIDIKGDGGYVVAPPSVHPTGPTYEWEVSGHFEDVACAQLRPWLRNLILRAHRELVTVVPEVLTEGIRNQTLIRIAGAMRRYSASAEAILAALSVENARRCVPPLEDEEVANIAASAGRYAPAAEGQRQTVTGGVSEYA